MHKRQEKSKPRILVVTPEITYLPEGMGKDTAHYGRTPHGAARGERAGVYCPSLWLRSWYAFMW